MMKDSNSGGWLVVDPYDRIALTPAPPLSDGEIRKRYRGFDGKVWPLGDDRLSLLLGLLPSFADAKRYYDEAACNHLDSRLQYLTTGLAPPTRVDGATLRFEGYDFGNFISVDNYFSCVLNELLYGVNGELRECLGSLNGSLLFPSLADAARFGDMRRALAPDVVSLEEEWPGEEFGPIAIATPVFDLKLL
jgi:hypothetical protein